MSPISRGSPYEKRFPIVKLVILDRDGTINHDSDQHIKSPAEWRPIDGSLEAIARLTQADYRIAVATNQSGIARGLLDTRTLFAIHDTLLRALAQAGGRIDAFFFCPHRAEDRCPCRKPQPGMLLEVARRFNVAIEDVSMVGDSRKDLEAAAAAGAKPVLVLTGKGKKTQKEGKLPPGTTVFADLAAFAEHLAP